jgi:cathepsin L
VGATCTGYVDIPHEDVTALQQAVATVGPISVAMDASQTTFRFYKSGVYYDSQCSETKLDHGVLAVGYGELNSEAYWLVKNSWGTSWGDAGYFMIAQRDNDCGIATQASYPTV